MQDYLFARFSFAAFGMPAFAFVIHSAFLRVLASFAAIIARRRARAFAARMLALTRCLYIFHNLSFQFVDKDSSTYIWHSGCPHSQTISGVPAWSASLQ